jgi:hypothetical protein
MLKPLWMLTVFACLVRSPVAAFTAYDCSNRSNVVESYSLVEPDACANMGRDGEVETIVYGEIVQIKQDRMIPVFRCTVIETLVAQYCGMFSAAGVTSVPQVPRAQAARGLGVPEGSKEWAAPH